MRILIFGASVTQGFWDTEGGGWVSRLQNNRFSPTFFNLAISGNTSAKVLERFEAETKARLWPGEELAFVIGLGTNDACVEAGQAWSSPEQYKQNMTRIIQLAKQYSSKILLVELTPCDESKTTPVSWGDYSYRSADIQKLNQVLAEISDEQKVPLVSIFAAFEGREKELLPDGLHPNAEGHKLIANLVKPHLEKLL
jgi:lysophospholipase L1-like esterase